MERTIRKRKKRLIIDYPRTPWGKRAIKFARERDLAKWAGNHNILPTFYKLDSPKSLTSVILMFAGGLPFVLFGIPAEQAFDAAGVLFWFGLSLALTGIGVVTVIHEAERVQVEHSMCMPV